MYGLNVQKTSTLPLRNLKINWVRTNLKHQISGQYSKQKSDWESIYTVKHSMSLEGAAKHYNFFDCFNIASIPCSATSHKLKQVINDGREMKMMNNWPQPFYNWEIIHRKWLREHAASKMKTYGPGNLGSERALYQFHRGSIAAIEPSIIIPLKICLQRHVLTNIIYSASKAVQL